jgi:hypothetical protein
MSDLLPREFSLSLSSIHSIHEDGPFNHAAWAFTTRRVKRETACSVVEEPKVPKAGDLVLARVDTLGHHKALQLPSGRRQSLFPGDEIVVVYGNRYAANQFEAIVPRTLGACHLVAGGGVAAKALSWHSRIGRGPTEITPVGLVADAMGRPLNVRDHALEPVDHLDASHPTVVAVVGTGMDSGKTQTAAYLVKGLRHAGVRVGYAKVTGTGAGGDTWLLLDAGARPVLDFLDAGLVSTYLASQADLERAFVTLVAHQARAGVDAVVIEVADGVLQVETARLLDSPLFSETVGGLMLAACDSMGAAHGVDWLRRRDLPIIGLSGIITASPLQSREALGVTGLRAYSREELARPQTAMQILSAAREHRDAHDVSALEASLAVLPSVGGAGA